LLAGEEDSHKDHRLNGTTIWTCKAGRLNKVYSWCYLAGIISWLSDLLQPPFFECTNSCNRWYVSCEYITGIPQNSGKVEEQHVKKTYSRCVSFVHDRCKFSLSFAAECFPLFKNRNGSVGIGYKQVGPGPVRELSSGILQRDSKGSSAFFVTRPLEILCQLYQSSKCQPTEKTRTLNYNLTYLMSKLFVTWKGNRHLTTWMNSCV